jgi:hypothetical protein
MEWCLLPIQMLKIIGWKLEQLNIVDAVSLYRSFVIDLRHFHFFENNFI